MILNEQVELEIKDAKYIIIAKHQSPDWDAFGSSLGLYHLIKDNFPNKEIFLVGEPDEYNLDLWSKNLDINIVKESLLITVDTANIERVDFDQKKYVSKIIKIDHHIVYENNFGNYNLVLENTIACCEVITLFALDRKWKISQIAARNLYKGLITDSNRFMYEGTSSSTFFVAATLKETGINIQEIYSELYMRSFQCAKWNAHVLLNSILSNGIIYYVATNDEHLEWVNDDLKFEQWKSVVDVFNNIKEVKIWMLIYPKDDGTFGVSLRSNKYSIVEVANKFNGGGHRLASGAKIKNLDEIPAILNELHKIINEGERK
ncbi:bifunctional oligoribonuclease/PAP phosphatase NrnA [Spiroplasma endosymbiont of Labia minor]|uniref:DHH family phosphoesterase n=1 Tax=Spiroplasma endosymbiont of Labia minor TaxID=3066305 RepID=UPI0030D21884